MGQALDLPPGFLQPDKLCTLSPRAVTVYFQPYHPQLWLSFQPGSLSFFQDLRKLRNKSPFSSHPEDLWFQG